MKKKIHLDTSVEPWKSHLGHTLRWAEDFDTGLLLALCVTCAPDKDWTNAIGFSAFLIDVLDDEKLKNEIREAQGGHINQVKVDIDGEVN